MDEAASRRLIDSRALYLEAMDELLREARRNLCIFDPDLRSLGLEMPARVELLEIFLQASRDNSLRIVVHDSDFAARSAPRLLALLKQHNDNFAIHHTVGEALRAQDCFILADEAHFVRRPVAAQLRGVHVRNDPRETHPWQERFAEIWQLSEQAISGTTLGL